MSPAERKFLGVLMQLAGAAIALGGITFISAAVAALIPLPNDPRSMLTMYGVAGASLFIGLAVIAHGGAMCTAPGRPACPRCASSLDEPGEARCRICGWELSWLPPE